MHKLNRFKVGFHPRHVFTTETLVSLFLAMLIFTMQVSAVTRFQQRSLFIDNSEPGATTNYTVGLTYATHVPVGSIDMLFCIDPIPTEPCNPPAGLNVSQAVLANQIGETGYTISTRTSNHLVLSRGAATVVGNDPSKYVFSGIVNPTFKAHSYAIRLASYASTDASGTLIDLGSVVTQVADSIFLQTQVPPMLIFCLAQQVSDDCTVSDGVNYSDMGSINPNLTLTTQSQMAVGTNASSGFVITANGTTMTAGNHEIPALSVPTSSLPGTNQFGINLVANSEQGIGSDPDGASTNAVATNSYSLPNKYMYKSGDVIASSPNVSLVRRFTASYLVNAKQNLPAGVYTTTITYICSGRF